MEIIAAIGICILIVIMLMGVAVWFYELYELYELLPKRLLRKMRAKHSQPEENIEKCTNHPNADAVATCVHCGQHICGDCAFFREEDEEVYCISCMDKLFPHV